MTTPQPVCSVGAMLGEGPLWDAAARRLWFVDIKGCQVHAFDPEGGALQRWQAPSQPGWVVPMDDGCLLAGLQSGLHRFDPREGSFELLMAPEADRPGNRLNDATIDSCGRLWFGSMDDGEQDPTGRVYRLAGRECQLTGIPPVCITNGPALSPDGQLLYHVDTLGREIHRYDVDDDGRLSRPLLFARIEDGQGYPDGPTVDSAGCLWIGLFGGWGARRYSPHGELLEQVRFPVANVTKITFGGDDLRTAYATTARKGLTPDQLARQPFAGDLFRFRVEVPGVAAHRLAAI